MIPQGNVIMLSELDQLKAKVQQLTLENASMELQMIELTMALMQLRHPMAQARLKELQSHKPMEAPNGTSGN